VPKATRTTGGGGTGRKKNAQRRERTKKKEDEDTDNNANEQFQQAKSQLEEKVTHLSKQLDDERGRKNNLQEKELAIVDIYEFGEL